MAEQIGLRVTRSSHGMAKIILGPEAIKLFSCSTKLSIKFQLLIKTKIMENKAFIFAFKLSDVVFSMPMLKCQQFIMLINVKMPTIVGILTFMSTINFMLSCVEHKKVL